MPIRDWTRVSAKPGAHVLIPLGVSYRSAFAGVPERWRRVLDGFD